MKLYKVKINSNRKAILDFVKFAIKNEISIYITWAEEDLFANILFLIVSVNGETTALFEGKYGKQIIETETLL